MALADLIQSTPALAALADANDAAGIVAAVNEKNIPRTESKLQTLWGYGDRYGTELSAGLLVVLDGIIAAADAATATLLRASKDAFVSRGLDLSNAKIQAQIDALIAAAGPNAAPLVALKAMGVWYTSLADTLGGDVTTEQVTAAITSYNAAKAYDAKLIWLTTEIWNKANDRANAVPNESLADFKSWVKQLVEGL